MLPIYGALHFVPPVLFKWGKFLADPGAVIVKAGVGSVRSSAFLGIFVVIYQSEPYPYIQHHLLSCFSAIFCYKHKLHKVLTELKIKRKSTNLLARIPQSVIDSILISKLSYWLLGFASGLALFVEERKRRAELAMYVLPKGLESMWIMLRGHGYVFKTGKWGETVVCLCTLIFFMLKLMIFFVQLTGIAMALVMVSEMFFDQWLCES